nr:macrolide family glycosyltransferase [Actinomadura flavalba]
MTRSHIAMVSTPFPGHVNPGLEVVRELAARGHRVTYANDPAYAERIAATGAEPLPVPSTILGKEEWPDDAVGAMDVFLTDAIAMLPRLRELYANDRPDVFLYDITGYAARALALNLGVPSVQLSPSAVAWDGYADDMADALKDMHETPQGHAFQAKFTGWLADNGIVMDDFLEFGGLPDRGLVLIPRAMQPNADRVDTGRFTFVGPCLPVRETETWTRPADAGNVLLVSLGSSYTDVPDFYRACLAAYGDLPGWHVVLQIGGRVDEAALGPIPANVEVHRWVPQRDILRQADAFVTHAGSGGCNEGLVSGVPMIAVPQAVDQFMNADRLVELGVARRLDSATATPDELRAALTDLTADPAVAARLAALREETRAEGGTRRAADLIEELVP